MFFEFIDELLARELFSEERLYFRLMNLDENDDAEELTIVEDAARYLALREFREEPRVRFFIVLTLFVREIFGSNERRAGRERVGKANGVGNERGAANIGILIVFWERDAVVTIEVGRAFDVMPNVGK